MHLPRKVAQQILLVTAGTALASCGGGDTAAGGPEWLAARAAPVSLTLDLETENSASRPISAAGGTITATAEDGTRFRLRIPEGALLSSTTITMTPVRAVKGLPLSGKGGYATVQLEPDGLQLMKPAVLSIRSKREIPAASQVAFAYYGEGDDAHLYPLGADPSKVELQLLHFSGYGFGEAPSDDPGRRALQRAASDEARLNAQLAEAISRERQRDAAQLTDEFLSAQGSHFVAYFDAVVAPLLKDAETNDKMLACATQKYLSWLRMAMLTAAIDDSGSSGDPELDRRMEAGARSWAIAMRHFYDTAKQRALRQCREHHDLSFPVTLISMVRQQMLLGAEFDNAKQMNDLIEAIQDVSRQCLKFEVEFESAFDKPHLGGGGVYYRLVAKVPFRDTVMAASAIPIGEGAITHTDFRARGNPGTGMFGANSGPGQLLSGTIRPAGTRDGVFKVLDLEYPMNPRRPRVDCAGNAIDTGKPATSANGKDEQVVKDSLTIIIAPGLPKEITHYTSHSPLAKLGGRSSWTDEAAEWADDWAGWHREEQVPIAGMVEEEGVHRMVGGAYRIKLDSVAPGTWKTEYLRYDNTGHLFEKTIITVRHRP